MKIVTTKQMAEIENMSEELGVTKKKLMYNAGIAITEKIFEICLKKKFLISSILFSIFLF